MSALILLSSFGKRIHPSLRSQNTQWIKTMLINSSIYLSACAAIGFLSFGKDQHYPQPVSQPYARLVRGQPLVKSMFYRAKMQVFNSSTQSPLPVKSFFMVQISKGLSICTFLDPSSIHRALDSPDYAASEKPENEDCLRSTMAVSPSQGDDEVDLDIEEIENDRHPQKVFSRMRAILPEATGKYFIEKKIQFIWSTTAQQACA